MAKQLFKSTLIVSSMTLISRLLGFIRDMLIARIFGVDIATDAFFVAFKIPNFLRRLYTEGAFAHAFIPTLSRYKDHHDKPTLRLFIDRITGTLTLILLVFTLIGVLTSPVLITLLAPGFSWQGAQHELAAQMLQITFTYLLFIGLVAFAGSVLNSHGQFAIPALTPVFLNICMIAAALWLAPLMSEPVTALAWGVLIAGIVQLLFQIPALSSLDLLPRFKTGFQDPAVRRVIHALLPAIFSVSVTQINLLLDTLVASFLKAGSVSWLYYSDRLVEFPIGILGLAVGTVILPSLSNDHSANDKTAFSASLDWGLRLVFLIGIPATIGLIMLAEPLLSTLFQYHEFGVEDVYLSAQSLRAYAFGLLGYLLIKVLVPGFTARQDMKTPVRYGIYAMIVSLALNVLAIPLAHAGLALATSLGAFFNAGLLFFHLRKDHIYRALSDWGLYLLRLTLASLAMIALLYYGVDSEQWFTWGSLDRTGHLAFWITASFITYGLTLLITGLRLRHFTHSHDRIA